MAAAALSNRERKELNRQRKARLTKRDGVVRVAVKRPADEEMDGRDGLVWLMQKGRLSPAQGKVAVWLSDLIRDAGDVALKSCLDDSVGGGGRPGATSPSPLVSLTTARRQLLVVRWQVLRGQPDMVLVVDGVCGARHTIRYLAGGDKHRARDLEVTLKLALDLVLAHRAEPGAA
jgi:hypothetical protein